MIGLLIIYFIGKNFYTLAEEHKRNKWVFALLGVVTYYIVSFIAAFFILLLNESSGSGFIASEGSDLIVSLMAMPFGILGVYIFYRTLKGNWSKSPKGASNPEILDEETFTDLT